MERDAAFEIDEHHGPTQHGVLGKITPLQTRRYGRSRGNSRASAMEPGGNGDEQARASMGGGDCADGGQCRGGVTGDMGMGNDPQEARTSGPACRSTTWTWWSQRGFARRRSR